MSQNFSQFLLGPTNPHDLFRVAREFLDSMTKGNVNAFGSSSHTTYPFAFSATANQQPLVRPARQRTKRFSGYAAAMYQRQPAIF